MAAVTRQKKSQVRQRRRAKTQSRRGKPKKRRTTVRRVNRHGKKRPAGKSCRKKRPAGKFSRKAWDLQVNDVRMTNKAQRILYFGVHDLYKKVSLAAERMRKKKCHNSITVSDIKIAMEKIMPGKCDGKPISSISKCH